MFTDSPLTMLQAEKTHRAHAIVEQAIADLKAGALAHLSSESLAAKSAWLVLAAIAFNLTRAAGTLASAFHAKATAATIRAASPGPPGDRVIHLSKDWPWQDSWEGLFNAACKPPTPQRPCPPSPDRRNQAQYFVDRGSGTCLPEIMKTEPQVA